MKVVFNSRVPQEVRQVISYYEAKSGPKLADEFFDELMKFIELASAEPTRFHPLKADVRRANLKRFPTIFFIASRLTTFGYWSSNMTAVIPISARTDAREHSRNSTVV